MVEIGRFRAEVPIFITLQKLRNILIKQTNHMRFAHSVYASHQHFQRAHLRGTPFTINVKKYCQYVRRKATSSFCRAAPTCLCTKSNFMFWSSGALRRHVHHVEPWWRGGAGHSHFLISTEPHAGESIFLGGKVHLLSTERNLMLNSANSVKWV